MRLLSKKEAENIKATEKDKLVKELSEVDKLLSEKRKELNNINITEAKQKLVEEFEKFSKDIANKKSNLFKEVVILEARKKEAETPARDIELVVIEKTKELDEIQNKVTGKQSFLDNLIKRELEVLERESLIKSKETMIEIREEQIEKEKDEIQKERVRIQSQQITLKNAFEELQKRKNI